MLRKNERAEVESTFAPSNALRLNLITVSAEDEFLGNLAGLEDPEAKRKSIGNTFIDVFEREAKKLPNAEWLAQGTIYPDVIVTPYLVLGGTDSRYYSGLTPNIYRFYPVWLAADDMHRFHGTNERIEVENFAKIVQFYIHLLTKTVG